MLFTGPGPDSGRFITEIQINGNIFSGNDTDAGHIPVIGCTFNCRGVQVHDNMITDESSGIYFDKVLDGSISGNTIKGCNENGINLVGCIAVMVTNNLHDSRNASGTATTTSPLLISGQYMAPNDALQFIITGNAFLFPRVNSVSISISNAGGVVLGGNRIEGTIVLAALVSVLVNGNQFSIPQTSQAILIDASDRGTSKISVIGNRFNFSGASINRCITTVDASATGVDDVLIESNATAIGQTFGIALYGHSGSNPATNVFLIGNTPEAASDSTLGWRNSGSNLSINKVFVSQAQGRDQSGRRQSRYFKFLTINAAIDAATSGDIVVVEDGTFNERIDAKDGITLRFLPPASLICTSSSGCIRSTANSQTFTVYHEHAAISCTQNSTDAINWTHAGAYLAFHASIDHTGAGTLPTAIRATNGTVEIWGYAKTAGIGPAITLLTGTPFLIVHGGLTGQADIASIGSLGLSALRGSLTISNAKITGGVELNMTNMDFAFFKQCTITNGGSSPAINITTVGSNVPLLRDCVLVAGSSSTSSILAGSAQTIKLYGQTVANKGPDPPTNVTFTGGGTYDVNANVTAD